MWRVVVVLQHDGRVLLFAAEGERVTAGDSGCDSSGECSECGAARDVHSKKLLPGGMCLLSCLEVGHVLDGVGEFLDCLQRVLAHVADTERLLADVAVAVREDEVVLLAHLLDGGGHVDTLRVLDTGDRL